ncbi:MAG: OmpH family outer membrane protein [Sphingomonas sp.]|nr:OmpH family outer membrane protein [Sphingomonas sp.]
MRNLTLLPLAAAVALSAPVAVHAQRLPAAVVAVVDTGRIYRECTACRAAQAQLNSQVTALQTRQRTLATQLQPEQRAIQAAITALQGRQPDAALRTRAEAYQRREQQAAQELQQGQQRVQSSQANVLRQINERLNPIINQVMTARGATLAVDTEASLAHSAGINVTSDVLARLNSVLPSVSVTPLPQQQQPQGR